MRRQLQDEEALLFNPPDISKIDDDDDDDDMEVSDEEMEEDEEPPMGHELQRHRVNPGVARRAVFAQMRDQLINNGSYRPVNRYRRNLKDDDSDDDDSPQ